MKTVYSTKRGQVERVYITERSYSDAYPRRLALQGDYGCWPPYRFLFL